MYRYCMETTLDAWEILQAVVQLGGFAPAAKKLNKSQSTISYAIGRLQVQLGVKLFEIQGRKAQLTEIGRGLLADAESHLAGFHELEKRARLIASGGASEVRLSVDSIYPDGQEPEVDALHGRIPAQAEAVMDKYDPEKKVTLSVDEWGAWHAPLHGSNPAFLVQQNSIRDAILASLNLNIFGRHGDRVHMANIAQMVNVLQAMVLTDKEKFVLTPTYYIFKMYVPFQDATLIPLAFDAGEYTHGGVSVPRVDLLAAKGADGKLLLEITNLDAENPVSIDADLAGVTVKAARGATLTAATVDTVNTFESPNQVIPKPAVVKVHGGKLSITVAPRSVTVVSVEQ